MPRLKLVAVEGIEPTSLDYQSSALAVELHREVVDPTGLKPAPHGLKGRRSVTRAPGQQGSPIEHPMSNVCIAKKTLDSDCGMV